MLKQDLVLNNLQGLIGNKTQPTRLPQLVFANGQGDLGSIAG